MSREIILVGNGPILKPLGTEIDEYTRVVRFNKFEIGGYAEGVGTRTTDWVLKSRAVRRYLWREDELLSSFKDHLERIYVRLVLGELISSFVFLMERFKLAPGAMVGFYRHRLDQQVYPEHAIDLDRKLIIWPDHVLISEFFEFLSSKPGKCPTTGLFGIMLALTIYPFRPIPIACFGPRDRFINTWYFDEQHEHVAHNFNAERLMINKWEERGLLTRIDS